MGVNRSQRGLRERGSVDSSGWDGQPIDYSGGGGLLPPVIDSVVPVRVLAGDDGFKDALTLSGGPIDEILTEYDYTHECSESDPTPPAFPGPEWTAYNPGGGSDNLEWDKLAAENGPLDQPPDIGPYIGATPYNSFATNVMDAGGGGRWKRIVVTVKNAAGQDSSEVFWQGDAF